MSDQKPSGMILRILDREKVNLQLPVFTLDVNQVALKDPTTWPDSMRELAPLEWNYFEAGSVEMCVTPETAFEITKGVSLAELPWTAYQRFKKTEFLKSRPSGTTLTLSEQEANGLWNGTRDILWPTVPDHQLNPRQRADVSQLYFHTVASGSTAANSAFLTIDQNFINRRNDVRTGLGVSIMTPNEAWGRYSDEGNNILDTPKVLL